MINVVCGEYNKAVPQARGTAERSIHGAEGDTAKCNVLRAEYIKAPAITKRRLYLDTIRRGCQRKAKEAKKRSLWGQ